MTWNYRIVRHCDSPSKVWFAVHEAYYKGDIVVTITDDPVRPTGETIEELKAALEGMIEAFDKPVLDYDDNPTPDRK